MSTEFYAIIIGIGIEVIFVILGIQVKEMPMWLAIIGYALGGICFIYGIIGLACPKLRISSVVKGKPEISKQYYDKREPSAKAETILTQMHKRMLKLKDKAVRQYRSEHNGKEFLDLHKNLMSAMAKNTDLEAIQKDIKGKKLSRIKAKKRVQIDNLHQATTKVISMNWSLDGLVEFINIFNRLAQSPTKRYEGLDILRSKDKKWNKLFDELQKIILGFSDTQLANMIDDYIKWSYGCSGLILHTELIRWYVRTEDLQSEYLRSEAYNPSVKLENTMTKLLINITNRIKELQTMSNESEKIVIKDTKVKLDADKVDKATGMEINNVPTELSNVQIDVEAKDAKEATGMKVISHNAPALYAHTVLCSCGKPFSYTSAAYKPSEITCPHCGKVYKCGI